MSHRISALFLPLLLAGPLGCNPRASQGAIAAEETPPDAAPSTIPKSRPNRQPPPVNPATCGLPESIREPDWPRTLETGHAGEPPVSPTLATLAILPDTQYYVSCREPHFEAQSRWLASQFERRNIHATLHLGDLTEHNTRPEWDFVKNALAPLKDRPLFRRSPTSAPPRTTRLPRDSG